MNLPRKPLGSVPWNKGKRIPTEIIPAFEIAKMLNQLSRVSATGLRNRALIYVLWRGGLRVSEALDLELRDIDMARCTLNVRHGKGDKQRMVAIDENAVAVLQKWLKKRSRVKGLVGTRVFCTLGRANSIRGDALTSDYVRSMLPRLAIAAGVERRIHAHAFRHSFAVELLYERVPLNAISAQLGHADLATTAHYLQHVTDPEVQTMMKARVTPQCVLDVMA